jgi:type I restriction enzyme, S subunit
VTETIEKRRRLGGREATAAQIPGAFAISVGDTGTPLPEGWKRYLLSDLARMESGHTPSRRHPEYWGGSIPWIGIRDATGNHGRTIYETNENTNELGIANSASRVLPKDTVCLRFGWLRGRDGAGDGDQPGFRELDLRP